MTEVLGDNKFKPIFHPDMKVIVANPALDSRNIIISSLKKLGIVNIMPMTAPSDIRTIVSREKVDWVISTLFADERDNMLRMMAGFFQNPKYSDVKVSLFLKDSEKCCLPAAFEVGLYSWHSVNFTAESLLEEFGQLVRTDKIYKGETAMTASRFLQSYLKDAEEFGELSALIGALIDHYPSHPELLMYYGEAKILEGDNAAGVVALRQASFLAPHLQRRIDEIVTMYNMEAAYDNGNNLGVDNLVIVDSDTTATSHLVGLLRELNVNNVRTFEDGVEAAKYIEETDDIGMVIQEWKIPKLSGAALLQRIRRSGKKALPIVIISSLVSKGDRPLLREMTVSEVIKKPITRDHFSGVFKVILDQEKNPSERKSLERKILQHLENGEMSRARILKARYLNDKNIPRVRKRLIEAHFTFFNGHYGEAKSEIMQLLKGPQSDSLTMINLLGKCLMHLRDYQGAQTCFEKANLICPDNIERLCSLAEIYEQSGDKKKVLQTIEKMRSVDATAPVVTNKEISLAIEVDDLDRARSLIGSLDSRAEIIGYMNNKAVTLVKQGRIKEGLEIYRRALKALPKQDHELKMQLSYNLGLALARLQEKKRAVPPLSQAITSQNPKLAAKARSLLARVKEAIETGQPIQLMTRESDRDMFDIEDGFDEIISAATQPKVNLGRLANDELEKDQGSCLRGIYHRSIKDSSLTIALMKATL